MESLLRVKASVEALQETARTAASLLRCRTIGGLSLEEGVLSLAGRPLSSADQEDKGHDQADKPASTRELENGEQQVHTHRRQAECLRASPPSTRWIELTAAIRSR